jgi:hypothetical protein
MKQPKPRGSAINTQTRRRAWLSTFTGYRHSVNETTIDLWLEQFDQKHRDIAARILDCVEFLTHEQMSQAFRSVLNSISGWHKDKRRRAGKWRFVPFSGSAGQSGDSMLHKFRLANEMSSKQYNELFIYRSDLLREGLGADDTVIFVDDFSGTGNQACEAWKTDFAELLPERPTTYLVLVAVNTTARQRIESETGYQLIVNPYIEFNDRDNIFSPACGHFNSSEKNIILKYCQTADKHHPHGYGKCGMVVVFAHNCPNNTIPILHVNNNHWEGLFRRYD